jgi:hypothetical protein
MRQAVIRKRVDKTLRKHNDGYWSAVIRLIARSISTDEEAVSLSAARKKR